MLWPWYMRDIGRVPWSTEPSCLLPARAITETVRQPPHTMLPRACVSTPLRRRSPPPIPRDSLDSAVMTPSNIVRFPAWMYSPPPPGRNIPPCRPMISHWAPKTATRALTKQTRTAETSYIQSVWHCLNLVLILRGLLAAGLDDVLLTAAAACHAAAVLHGERPSAHQEPLLRKESSSTALIGLRNTCSLIPRRAWGYCV